MIPAQSPVVRMAAGVGARVNSSGCLYYTFALYGCGKRIGRRGVKEANGEV